MPKKNFKNLAGFHIRLENRLRATNFNFRLPDKTFWLPDSKNTKTYNKTFGCPVGKPQANFWLPDSKKWLPRATGQPVM